MKKYIQFFRNKKDKWPVASFPLYQRGGKMTGYIQNDAHIIKRCIDTWMSNFPEGKVDFIQLPPVFT
jgi:hypothetical protein